MGMTKLIIGLVVGCLSFTSYAQDDEQFNVGQKKAAVCMTCHGSDGISNIDIYPNLQGQKMEYLVTTLKAYQRRQRSGGLALVMYEQADSLTEQDMQDISYFFSKVTSSSNTNE